MREPNLRKNIYSSPANLPGSSVKSQSKVELDSGQLEFCSGRARLQRLRKNSDLPQLLGGAALQRCGQGFVLNPASAAEVVLTASVRVSPQSLQPFRNRHQINGGF
jgi:hypothetical protein